MADEPLDFGTLEKYGCFVGSHAVVILSDKDDMKAVALNLMKFFEDESCGQCTPCRVGTEKAAKLMASGPWEPALLDELSAAMRDASICGLGQAAMGPFYCPNDEKLYVDLAFYRDLHPVPGTLATFTQLQGKELSYNNLADADAAWECVRQFERPACVIVKHANPCGAAEGDGWLLAAVWRAQENRSDLAVFNAKDVEAGPVALVHLGHRVPDGFHGNWVGAE